MKKTMVLGLMLVLCTLLNTSFDSPKGWYKAGSKPDKYEMGIDKGAGRNGGNCAIIRSNKRKILGFGTLMQTTLPDKYLGKRVKMSGYMKSEDVNGWAGFWMRVDKAGSTRSLAFDNMSDRAIKGTTEWRKYEVVLDVSVNAADIAFGALLSGTGTIWFDDLQFEIVDQSATVTGTGIIKTTQEPTNLGFEE